MDIRFSEDEMSRLYHKYRGVEYTALRDFYEPGYASRNEELAQPLIYLKQTEEFLSKFVAMPETILDWGGDTGVNPPFKNQVSEVIIYDISAKLDEEGTSLSDKHRLVSKTFDLIACCNVLEHVPHPSTVLAEIKEFMTAGTVLFIEVPFETIRVENNSVSALHMKRHWHEHINFYSELSLRRLTYNSGLDVIALRTIATNEKGNQAHVFQLICRKC
jgi:predicted TPR repeat methyltransferase